MNQKFCKKCGEELSSGLAFCSACGTPIPDSNPVIPNEEKGRPKKPMSMKTKVLLSIVSVLVVAIVGTHFILSTITDNTKQLKNIYNSIVDENGEALFAQLTVPEDVLYVKKSFTKQLNDDHLSEFFKELTDAVERVKEYGIDGNCDG